MHKNLIWQAFLAIVFLTTLWYTGKATYRYYIYSHLTSQTTPTDIKWTINPQSDETFILEASYQFMFKQHSFSGMTSFDKEPYRNRFAAESGVNEFSKHPLPIWFDPSYPERSSLQKNFPFKESVSAIFLWMLSLYFIFLGYYVAKYKS